jgi:hypothetical protein
MPSLNAMAVFCEDIREEKNDILTLIGLLPDTVELQFPSPRDAAASTAVALVDKLCIYIRINFDPESELSITEMRLVMPDSTMIPIGQFDQELIEKAKSEAKTKGNILAGVISRATMSGFRPPIGLVRVEADINSETHLLGTLMFKMNE